MSSFKRYRHSNFHLGANIFDTFSKNKRRKAVVVHNNWIIGHEAKRDRFLKYNYDFLTMLLLMVNENDFLLSVSYTWFSNMISAFCNRSFKHFHDLISTCLMFFLICFSFVCFMRLCALSSACFACVSGCMPLCVAMLACMCIARVCTYMCVFVYKQTFYHTGKYTNLW
jgi:hypothetical protein